MIISHKHKFLFIEIHLTASWAIHNELCRNYDGRPILHKHATYAEFRRHASEEELGYFVFATVRNPLDKIVSIYHKLKNDFKEVYSNANSLPLGIVDYSDLNKYQYIKRYGIDFESYFKRYYKRPYSDMIDLSSKFLNHVLRYKSIRVDFTNLLMKLGIEQIQPLPYTNVTPGKSKDYLAYYTPAIVPQAKRVFGPFMKKWNYQFPEGWGGNRLSLLHNTEYQIINWLKFLYAVHLRYNNASHAVFFRKLRARMFP